MREFIEIVEKKLLDVPTASPETLADRYGVSVADIERRLAQGIKVEREHTSDPSVAREIALDHLGEKLDYYDLLAKVEEGEVIDFAGRAKKPEPAPQEIDHGDGWVSKPFSISDMVNDPPVPTEYVEASRAYRDEPVSIRVGWQDARSAEIPLFEVTRLLKLPEGQSVALNAHADNRYKADGHPDRVITVTRVQGGFLVKLQHFFRDHDNSVTARDSAPNYMIQMSDFMLAAQEALKMARTSQ